MGLWILKHRLDRRDKTFPYNPQRRAFPHGKAANRVRWGTKQP